MNGNICTLGFRNYRPGLPCKPCWKVPTQELKTRHEEGSRERLGTSSMWVERKHVHRHMSRGLCAGSVTVTPAGAVGPHGRV